MRLGAVYVGHNGVHFEEDCFEDGESIKWLCSQCAGYREILPCYLDEEYCNLCGQEFEMEPEGQTTEMLVRVEEVTIHIGRTELPVPSYSNGGHIHLMCAVDDWDLPLWNWNLDRDVPCP